MTWQSFPGLGVSTLVLWSVTIPSPPQSFREIAVRLGRAERKTERATVSLIAIIIVHLCCHSIKAFINGFQIWQVGG